MIHPEDLHNVVLELVNRVDELEFRVAGVTGEVVVAVEADEVDLDTARLTALGTGRGDVGDTTLVEGCCYCCIHRASSVCQGRAIPERLGRSAGSNERRTRVPRSLPAGSVLQ